MIEYGFKFEPAFDDLSKILFKKNTKATAQQYWCVDENETRFILTQIEETIKPGVIVKYEEAFIIISSPSHPSQCLIYFFTNVGCPGSFLCEINPQNMTLLYMEENHEDGDAIDEEIDEENHEVSLLKRNVIQSNGVTDKVNQNRSLMFRSGTVLTYNEDDDNLVRFDPRFKKGNVDTITRHKPAVRVYEENPNNFRTNGVPCGLSERLIGYFRLEDGLLWCHNQEELASQKGLVMDLLRKAGEKLMRGQGVVSISLPVRIFETRSALERCADLWTCGLKYLPLAGTTNDPIERLKFAMCFMIGSMYKVCKQQKPFNPILGETYQAHYPDGTAVYMEHISHHPPISTFLVEHPEGLYKIEGSYTYTAILVNLGN